MFSQFKEARTRLSPTWFVFASAIVVSGLIAITWHHCQASHSQSKGIGGKPAGGTAAVIQKGESKVSAQQSFTNPWQPIRLSPDAAFEVVRFGPHNDFLVLGSNELRRLRGDSGKTVWSARRADDTEKSSLRQFKRMSVLLPAWDLNNDGVEDVLLYSKFLDIDVFSGKTGEALWSWTPKTRVITIPFHITGDLERFHRHRRPAIRLERTREAVRSRLVIQYLAVNDATRRPQWRSAHIAPATGQVLHDQTLRNPPNDFAGLRLHCCLGPGPHTDRMWTLPSKNRGLTRKFNLVSAPNLPIDYTTAAYQQALNTAMDEGRHELTRLIYTADFNGDGTSDLFWLEERRSGQNLIHRMPGPERQRAASAE